MPLTTAKLAHIQAMVKKTFAGRAIPVILTLRTPAGATTTLQINAVFRVAIDVEPSLIERSYLATPDAWALFNTSDVSLAQLRATIYLTFPNPQPPNQPGLAYTLVDVEPFGMTPGFSRFFTKWAKEN